MAAAGALLAACGGGGGSSDSSTAVTPTVTVGSILADGVDRGVDGLWVYIDDGGAEKTTLASGVENRTTLAPADPGTRFKIASISKMFIAVASVKAVQSGVLRLDDTLAFWLPDTSARIANAQSITVRQLLQHRSGVPDFDSQPGFSWRQSHTDGDTLLALIYDQPADFAPDQQYAYSNSNYLLLGRVLDAALGYHHRDFIQNSILSPLGLTDTFHVLGEADTSSVARGYWDGIDRTAQDYTIPGGSMVSTARDVGVFVRELSEGMLLNAVERQRYEALFGASYGHSGWLPGYQSQARRVDGLGTVIVLFANTTGGESERVAGDVYDALVRHLSQGGG